MKLKTIKWAFFICLFAAVCYINLRYEIFALNTFDQRGTEETFRVMTYNVNAPLGNEDIDALRLGLIDKINHHRPDILCLQELSSANFGKIKNTLDSLFHYNDSLEIKKQTLRYLLYSKLPIRNFNYHPCLNEIDTTDLDSATQREVKIYKRQLPFYSAEIEVKPSKWVKVFSCHLRSSAYSTARRSMDEDASWRDGLPVYYENYKIGQKIRNWEADNFRQYLEALEEDDTPVIIAGDFNDWSGSYCMNIIRGEKYKDAWWEGGVGFGITYDGWHLKLRLDHILYSHHFKLENVYVEKSKFSDHRPLIADFSLLP